MPPPATAAPSVLTASPIQAPATSGSRHRNVCARNGRINTSITANTTTREETSTDDWPCADGAAGGDRGGNAANRNARRQRRRPFAVEAEPLARDEIHDRPIDEIGLDDRGDAAQQQRGREVELAGSGDGEEAAKDHNRDLDVELRPDRFFDRLGEAGKDVGDDQSREQRKDKAAFIGQTQRPADAELLQFGRRDRGEIGVAADHPTGVGDREHRAREIDTAFEQLLGMKADGIVTASDPIPLDRREQIVAFANRHKLPVVGFVRQFAAVGALLSYGPSISWMYRQAGDYVGQILKGARPAELPVMQPTKFELVVNLKTAKAFGLDVPDKLLAVADEVIE